MYKKEADIECLLVVGETLNKVKTIFQRPCSLEADVLYSHMQVVAPRPKPHSLALVISNPESNTLLSATLVGGAKVNCRHAVVPSAR